MVLTDIYPARKLNWLLTKIDALKVKIDSNSTRSMYNSKFKSLL